MTKKLQDLFEEDTFPIRWGRKNILSWTKLERLSPIEWDRLVSRLIKKMNRKKWKMYSGLDLHSGEYSDEILVDSTQKLWVENLTCADETGGQTHCIY